jgi:hypothetical protein
VQTYGLTSLLTRNKSGRKTPGGDGGDARASRPVTVRDRTVAPNRSPKRART